MKTFIHEENIKLFRKRLAETTDPEKRQLLLKLLEEEEAKEDAQSKSAMSARVESADLTLWQSLSVYPEQRTSPDRPNWSGSCHKQTSAENARSRM